MFNYNPQLIHLIIGGAKSRGYRVYGRLLHLRRYCYCSSVSYAFTMLFFIIFLPISKATAMKIKLVAFLVSSLPLEVRDSGSFYKASDLKGPEKEFEIFEIKHVRNSQSRL